MLINSPNISGSLNVSGNTVITGSLTTSIAALNTPATTFLTSNNGTIRSRTAAQTLSDIGAQATGSYVTSATASGSYVTIATDQSITGVKTFTKDVIVNGINIGLGAGNIDTNTRVGTAALLSNTTGFFNVALGRNASTSNTTGNSNTSLGYNALYSGATASFNTAVGALALESITGGGNVAVGNAAGRLTTANAINTTSTNSIYIGNDSSPSASGNTNEIIIGHGADGSGSNTVTIGNSSITDNYLKGNVRATTFYIAAAGTASPTIIRNTSGTTGSTGGHNTIGFNSNNNIFVDTTNSGGFILSFNNSVANRTYNLKDASGTLAFTSDIPTVAGSYLPLTGGGAITGSLIVTGGITGNVTGSATTASYVEYSNVANKPTLLSGSVQIRDFGIFATTGSNQFNGSQSITGSLTVSGQVIAQTLNVQQVTSSIVYSSGSNIFGNNTGNTHQFTGSVSVTGSLAVGGVTNIGTRSGGSIRNLNIYGATNANAIIKIDGADGNGYGAQIDFVSKQTGGTSNTWTLGTGINGGTNAFELYNGSSTSLSINLSGSVGIGTSSPVQKLHVEGSTAIGTTGTEDILLLGRALSGGVSFQQAASLKLGRYQNAGGSFESYTRLDFALRDNSASSNYNTNTTVMTLTNAGNVGIGTTSPTGRLMLYQSSAGNVFQNIVSNQGGSTQVGINLSPSMTDAEVASNPAQASIYATDSNYGANIIFATKATGAVGNALVTRLTIASTGAATFSSSVGINGVTNPAAELQVGKSSDVTIAMSNSSSVTSGNRGSLAWYNSSVSTVANIRAVAVTDNVGTELQFYTRPAAGSLTQVMTLGSSGRLGIGETSPVSSLVVSTPSDTSSLGSSGIVIQGSSTLTAGNVMALSFTAIPSTTRARAAVGSVVGSDWGKGNLTFYTRDASDGTSLSTADERMRINSDGNVLVGATNADVGGTVKGAVIRQNGSIVGATNISSPAHYQSPITADRMNTQGDGLMYGMWRQGIFQAGIGATNASVMTFFTGNNDSMTERMRITSGGSLQINYNPGGGDVYFRDTTNGAVMFYIIPATYVGTAPFNVNKFLAANSSHISFETGGAERVRITNDNNVLFNTTSTSTSNTSSFIFRSGTSAYSGVMIMNHATTNNTGAGFIDCYYNTNYIGGIVQNGASNVSFPTSSDYRLKKDLKDFNGLNLISNLKVYDFKWKIDDSRMYGVIAHELQEYIPYAVHGNKDEMKENGKIKVQVVDYSKLVPVLVKAIQELKAENDILKSRIDTLEQA